MEYGNGQLLLGMGGSGASLSIDDGGRLTSNGSIIGKGNHRREAPRSSCAAAGLSGTRRPAAIALRWACTRAASCASSKRAAADQGGECRVRRQHAGRVRPRGHKRADSEWDAGANAIVLGSYGGNGELAVLNLSRVKAGAIMVGGDPANPGSDGAGVLRIGAGAVIETGQVAAPAAGAGSVIADGGVLRLTGGQPALFSGFKTGDIRLGRTA